MRANDFKDFLLDLGPDDLDKDLSEKTAGVAAADPEFRAALKIELSYLRNMSGLKVDLPDERYFAETRRRILHRVQTERQPWAARFKEILRPLWVRPVPRFAAGIAAVAILLFALMKLPSKEEQPATVAYGPPATIGEVYNQQVESLPTAEQIRSAVRERSDFLLRAAAILSSPSSLSRSTVFVRGGK